MFRHCGVQMPFCFAPFTGKPIKSQEISAVFSHCIDTKSACKLKPSEVNSSLVDNFTVLCSAKFDNQLLIKESLLILRDRPCLNENVSSCPLFLF